MAKPASSHWLMKAPLLIVLCLLLSACFNNDPIATWSTSVQGVYSADFTSDGSYALVGSIQHGGSLWRTADAERLYNWNHEADINSAITALAFSPEGDYAVTADAYTMVLWDVHSGDALRFFNAPGEILSIALTPRADRALLALRDERAILFDIQRGGIVHEMDQGSDILSQAISANGRYALFALDDKRLRYWRLDDASVEKELESPGRVHTIALSEDGRLAFMAVQHRDATILDMQTGESLAKLKYNNPFFPSFSAFLTARFYSDGRQILTGNTTGAMELWDTTDGSRIDRWITPKSSSFGPTNFSVVAVALLDADQQVLAMTSNGTVYSFALSVD